MSQPYDPNCPFNFPAGAARKNTITPPVIQPDLKEFTLENIPIPEDVAMDGHCWLHLLGNLEGNFPQDHPLCFSSDNQQLKPNLPDYARHTAKLSYQSVVDPAIGIFSQTHWNNEPISDCLEAVMISPAWWSLFVTLASTPDNDKGYFSLTPHHPLGHQGISAC
ncbi:hypothetical protein CROQUDRAFT_135107 [Cronartium quercuum f. sp. fusiforme G11]|uniref:Uncharacterized protein n=1 Tax=Cronartium quercuum f. sp. fusiforme G11 TaxID=708437 RepID=A0A9P6NFG6_9BASI|nr:hypothetical protein CROQUDRAFT_135107 [Cronartium quercuum f. sp. fusiforme G11]